MQTRRTAITLLLLTLLLTASVSVSERVLSDLPHLEP